MMNHKGEVRSPKIRKFIVSSILSKITDPSLFAHGLVSSVSYNSLSLH